jgi:ABC-type nitrate/sulfonate/bicarbonate transport system substrate-binding protein
MNLFRFQPLLLVCALVLLPVCGQAQTLLLGLSRNSLSLPVQVAQARGFFATEGVAVQTVPCVGGNRCMQMMFDGQVQLATASELPVMFNSFTRNDYAIVATFVTSPRDIKLVVRKTSGIAKVEDLVGKRVGTVLGTSAQYFLDTQLLFANVDPKAVQVVGLAPGALKQALQDAQLDAIAVWEPLAHFALAALAGNGQVLNTPRVYTETFNLVAPRSLISSREADVVKLLRALLRAQDFIQQQPVLAQAVLKEQLQVDQAFVDATWKDFSYRLGLNQSLISTMEGQARWAIREGHAPADSKWPNFLDFVATEPLRKVAPAAVTLVR